MGVINEQIRSRILSDDEAFAETFAELADSVLGGHKVAAALQSNARGAKDAIAEILKWYGVKARDVPPGMDDLNDQLEYLLQPTGVMHRAVRLEDGWYRDCAGAMLGRTADGAVVALLPRGYSGYAYKDHQTGRTVRINRQNQKRIEAEAFCFYRPLPLRPIGIKELLAYAFRTLDMADIFWIVLATLAAALIGMLPVWLNNFIFTKVIVPGGAGLILPAFALLICALLASTLIGVTRSLIMARIQTKMDLSVNAAAMMRTYSLPADFFKAYSAGELSSRIAQVQSLCSSLVNAVLSTGLTSLFSLIYLGQIFRYAAGLVVPALGVVLATLVITVAATLARIRISRQRMELGATQYGLEFALISGIQKIKLAGAEKRAFAKWGKAYARTSRLTYSPPMPLRVAPVLTTAISLAGTIITYYTAVKTGVSLPEYMAFNVAFGMVSGAFLSLASITATIANIKPILDMARPILETVPEIADAKQAVTRLSGGIELSNVSFRYAEDMPLVLDDLSLKIRPGQYVAIVGKTGCGKSTLMRMMLGFEKPQKGAVYYDGKDLQRLDLPSLRRHIGAVMQDGKLFSGDIYSNIAITAPWLTLQDAWDAAEKASVAEDIRAMPMGMFTYISEGQGGISGGQRQRFLIARAIAPKPRILLFDEATSALDNIAQKAVSEALAALKCTRVVIAHRLSTIRECDRIVVLDGGKIVEDGSYDALIEKGGFFAELVRRQRPEDGADHPQECP